MELIFIFYSNLSFVRFVTTEGISGYLSKDTHQSNIKAIKYADTKKQIKLLTRRKSEMSTDYANVDFFGGGCSKISFWWIIIIIFFLCLFSSRSGRRC
jgi:hypothetical protein